MLSAQSGYQLPKVAGKFDICQKGFLLTYTHCELQRAVLGEHLVGLGACVVVVARETHGDGEHHLHAWVEFEKKKHVRSMDFFDYPGERHCNIGVMKDGKKNCRANALQYITKEDKEPWCHGIDIDEWKEAKKKHREVVAGKLISGRCTLKEIIDEYPQELYNIDKLQRNLSLYKVLSHEVPLHIPRDNYWIYGKPRVGKSYAVRRVFPNLFMKPINKWWDGYSGEDVVLLDDFDKSHQVLGHYMKIWGDNYRFNGEVKGGMIMPSYARLIVTSNYKPDDIWKEDFELLEAIKGRFKVIEMVDRAQQPEVELEIQGLLRERKLMLMKKRYRDKAVSTESITS